MTRSGLQEFVLEKLFGCPDAWSKAYVHRTSRSGWFEFLLLTLASLREFFLLFFFFHSHARCARRCFFFYFYFFFRRLHHLCLPTWIHVRLHVPERSRNSSRCRQASSLVSVGVLHFSMVAVLVFNAFRIWRVTSAAHTHSHPPHRSIPPHIVFYDNAPGLVAYVISCSCLVVDAAFLTT